MKFKRVARWTWRRFFAGEMSIHTCLDATEDQVRKYIESAIDRGAGGNYAYYSLSCKIVKVKENQEITKV